MSGLADRVEALESKLDEILTLLAQRSGGRAPTRSPDCIKGLDPENCPKASTHQYQKQCGGASCRRINTEYYSPAAKAARAAGTPVATPKRKSAIADAEPKTKVMRRRGTSTEG